MLYSTSAELQATSFKTILVNGIMLCKGLIRRSHDLCLSSSTVTKKAFDFTSQYCPWAFIFISKRLDHREWLLLETMGIFRWKGSESTQRRSRRGEGFRLPGALGIYCQKAVRWPHVEEEVQPFWKTRMNCVAQILKGVHSAFHNWKQKSYTEIK